MLQTDNIPCFPALLHVGVQDLLLSSLAPWMGFGPGTEVGCALADVHWMMLGLVPSSGSGPGSVPAQPPSAHSLTLPICGCWTLLPEPCWGLRPATNLWYTSGGGSSSSFVALVQFWFKGTKITDRCFRQAVESHHNIAEEKRTQLTSVFSSQCRDSYKCQSKRKRAL